MFKGSYVAIVTPFNDDYSINYQKFEELLKWHLTEGTHGIVVCGTTGEGSTINDVEKLELFKLAVKVINKKIPVIANCGSNDTMHSLKLSKQAKEIGVDGLLLINPYYNKCNNEGMYQHFATIAKSVDLPIMLYNVPGRTGAVIPIPVVKRLITDFKNIVAIKDAGGDINYSLKIVALKNIALLSGDDNSTTALIGIGGVGVVSVVANIIPHDFAKMVELALNGNLKEAIAIQIKYQNFVDKLFIETNPIPIKEAMNLKGLQVGGYRLPLTKMNESNLLILKEEMKNL